MKLLIIFALFVLFVAGSLEASNKKTKEQWEEKKLMHQNEMQTKEPEKNDMDDPSTGYVHNSLLKKNRMKKYGKKVKFHKKSKKARKMKKWKKSRKAMNWLSLRSDADCKMKCLYGQVCISSPVMPQPICMHKKDLKKSMKFLHKFHKKDIKAWKRHQKKKGRREGWKLKEEKYGKHHKKQDTDAWRRKKIEKLEKKIERFNQGFSKKPKHHRPGPKHTNTVCGDKEFGQMKTRLMAWFHLLHGQDLKARKEHGGSIKKFYKHVSIKKELREYNGERCECMKSGVWQFKQLDVDQDRVLTHKELSALEENSLEPCMGHYLKSCDTDKDGAVSDDEWCCCFNNIVPPCYKQLMEIKKSRKRDFLPRCDKEGYYMLEQCKGESPANRVCWCVDQNGNEYADTAKKGSAHCHKIEKFAMKKKETVPFV